MDLLGLAFVLIAVAIAGYAIRDQFDDVRVAIWSIQWWRPVCSLALVVAGLLCTAQVWRGCLAALGRRLPTSTTNQIFFPAQVGKYLPGSVWPFLAQVHLARRCGVPGGLALLSGAVFLTLHLATAVMAAATLLLTQPTVVGRLGWTAVLAPLSLLLLHPKAVNTLARRIGRRSGITPPQLTWSHLAVPAAWMVPAWLGYGVAGYLVAEPFTGSSAKVAVLCVGGFAAGWLVGLLVFVAPAGVGAREAMLVLALAPVTGLVAATIVSVILRLCHTVADVGLALGYGLVRGRVEEGTGA